MGRRGDVDAASIKMPLIGNYHFLSHANSNNAAGGCASLTKQRHYECASNLRKGTCVSMFLLPYRDVPKNG